MGYKREVIFEMANVDPRDHKFGVDVKLNILQPGDKKPSHGPRIKVFMNDIGDSFSISLNKDPEKIKVVAGESFLSVKKLKLLISKIKKYRMAFLDFWNNPSMTTRQLVDRMEEIDKGGL